MKMTKHSLVDEYKKLRPIYKKCTKKFDTLVRDIIKESGLEVHSITSRTKKIDSFSKKVLRKIEKYEKVTDVTDLAGVRICCLLSSEVDKAAGLIRDNFILIPEQSIDKRDTLDPDRFGYLSLHYVVKLSDNRADLPEFRKYKDLLCEIQLRTILQHAWAEIEHDLGYKSDEEIPRKIRRQFSRLAGLLELADEQFDNIKEQIEDYSEEVEKEVITKPKDVAIDMVSISAYLSKSALVDDIDKKIAEISGWLRTEESISPAFLVRMCNFFSIKTIQELERILQELKGKVINYTKLLYGDKKLKEITYKGISVFFLGHVLIAKSRNNDLIKARLNALSIGSRPERSKYAKDLLKVADELFKNKN